MRRFFIILLFGNLAFGQSVSIEIRDFWTAQPVEEVRAVCTADTVFSDVSGRLFMEVAACDSLRISHPGYFQQVLSTANLQNEIIYLLPVESTSAISILADPLFLQNGSLPAVIERLSVEDHSLSSTLSRLSSVQIRDYGGSGQTQTIRMRGMSAEQTQVLFDGIPINNLQLSQTDLGLIDGGLISSVDVYRGGGMPFGGSGAIGGTVNLRPQNIESGWRGAVNISLASLQNQHFSGRAGYGSERWQGMVALSRSSGENNFSFTPNGHKITLQNRDYKNLSRYGKLRFLPDAEKSVELQVLHILRSGGAAEPFQGSYSDSGNVAAMDINNTLLAIKYNRRLFERRFELQFYQRNEWMEYAGLNLFSRHFNKEQGWRGTINLSEKQSFFSSTSIYFNEQKAISTNLSQTRRSTLQHDLFAVVNLPWSAFNWQMFSTFRSLYFPNTEQLAFLPGAALQVSGNDWHSHLSIQKNYRLPGLNDLYWQPGGNPDLKPELSLATEWGIERGWPDLIKKVGLETALTLYQNEVHDMIRWQPGANYWRPANIRGVRARGLEISAQAGYGKILGMQGSYFINATVKTASESNADHTVGNFVPQVPREAFAAAAYFSRAGWRLDVEYRHNGYQYLTFENDDFLPAVGLLHCALQKELYFDRWQFRLSGRGRNLLSESYQIVPGYPQPEHPLYEIEFEIKY